MFKGANYINGEWTNSRNDFNSINPCDETVLGVFPESSQQEVNSAVEYASRAFADWRKISRIQRGEYLKTISNLLTQRKEEFVNAISLETGKNLNESLAEVNEAIHMLDYSFSKARMPVGEIVASEIADKDACIIRKPKGVIGVITPWNFPAAIFFWNAAPAILEGNTVVFKPSEETPIVAQMAVDLYDKAGVPPGVINLVHGRGSTGQTLSRHAEVKHICFTGSAEVGQQIKKTCASVYDKSCSCEMGSKSAVIVCSDADLDMAAEACITSAFKLSGQRCVSAGRLIIDHSVFDVFLRKFMERVPQLKVGSPFAENTPDMGPLINLNQLKKVMECNRQTLEDDTTQVILNGTKPAGKGYFITPHVYTTKWKKDENRFFLKNEVFGPHVALLPFDDLDEAINIYNDTDYGLALAVLTNDYRKMRKVRDNCNFGLGYVNLPSIGAESHLPFGGIRKSGFGGASAAATFDAVTHKVTWTVNHSEHEFKMAQGLK